MSMMELPVRPRPLPSESLEGYLLRIVARNGWQHTSQLLKYLGLHSRFYIDNLNKLRVLSEKLSPCLRLEPAELVEHFSEGLVPTWLYDENRALQDLRVRFPRLCPACVNQTGFHWHWTLAAVSHCSVHGHPLWDCCPKCEAPLEWHADLYSGCPHCGCSWEPEDATLLPEHQQAFQTHIESGVGIGRYIQDLTLAMRVVLRPYDSMHDTRGHWPDDHRYVSTAVCDAYTLITQADAVREWAEGCLHHRSCLEALGSDVVLQPIEGLQNALQGDWPIKHHDLTEMYFDTSSLQPIDHDFSEASQGWVRPARLKIASDATDLWFQVNPRGVTRVLDLKIGSANVLVKQGVLQPINSTHIARDQMFDLRDIATLMCRIPESTIEPEGHIELEANDIRLRRHGVDYSVVLAEALAGRLSATRPEGSTKLSKIWISVHDLELFLRRCLRNICSGTVPLQRAGRILGKSLQNVRKLTTDGRLKLTQSHLGNEQIDGESLWEYIESRS